MTETMWEGLVRGVYRKSRLQVLWFLLAITVVFLLIVLQFYLVLKKNTTSYKDSLFYTGHTVTSKNNSLFSLQLTTKNNTLAVVSGEVRQKEPEQKCIHPTLNPYDPAIMQFYKPEPPIDCSSAVKEWVYVINGTIYISAEAEQTYGNILCECAPVLRRGDFSVVYGPSIKPISNGTQLQSDFFRIHCTSKKGKEYTNVLAAVAMNTAAMMRAGNYHSSAKSSNTFSKRSDDQSSSFRNLNLSVVMLGFDSLSRMAWQRHLPEAHKYFVDVLGAIELEGYNIVGDGTPAALLPILTGKMEEELPEARRGYEGVKPVDNHPWIWREFSKHGYITAYAEDMPSIGTFWYRMLGFQDRPTDHYMRPFYLAADKAALKNPHLCWGSIPRHRNFMNWFGSLLDMYRDVPKLFFGFYSEISHNSNNRAHVMDNDLVAFLEELEMKGHLNSTMLILMADHGARYTHVRSTTQGKLEERLPYFSFRFPPWFSKLYPTIIKNLKVNAKRLTTPFDIHATLQHMLNYSSTTDVNLTNRAISLFKEIPKERTCTDAEVTPHWCACLNWKPVNLSDPLARQAVATAIQAINGYTQPHRWMCAKLKLHTITKSLRYTPSSHDRSAEWKILKYAKFLPPAITELYQVSFQTVPGHAHFEVTCKLDVNSRRFTVEAKEISRINKYGPQPACIQDHRPDLRPFCYCV